MLTVCVSASSTSGAALTTTATLRNALGTTATSEDSFQQTLIVAASRWAETFLGYPALAQVYSESLPGYGGRSLMVSRTPVRAVLRLFDSTTTCQATELLSTDGDYRVENRDAGLLSRDEGFEWSLRTRTSAGVFNMGIVDYYQPGMEERPWLVEYVAGWTLDGMDTGSSRWSTVAGTTSTGRTLPEDLEWGVVLKAKELYLANDGVQSKSVGDLSITYRTGDQMGPAEALLTPWRRLA